eukprot:SAG31_NODE_6333_length_2062_cov_1.289862_1_plen_165_part_10
MEATVSEIIAKTLEKLDLEPPKLTDSQKLRLKRARADLKAEFEAAGEEVPVYSTKTSLRGLEQHLCVVDDDEETARRRLSNMKKKGWSFRPLACLAFLNRAEGAPSRQQLRRALDPNVTVIAQLQRKLAQSNHTVLLVFQAMDAAGKDSTISSVLSGVNPAGCQV